MTEPSANSSLPSLGADATLTHSKAHLRGITCRHQAKLQRRLGPVLIPVTPFPIRHQHNHMGIIIYASFDGKIACHSEGG